MAGNDRELVNAIAALREDLQGAMDEGRGQNMQFGVGDIELTLQLVATKQVGGKIGWSLVGIDAGGQSERTHTVRLTLSPRYRAPDGTYTADFTVTDQIDGDPGIGTQRT